MPCEDKAAAERIAALAVHRLPPRKTETTNETEERRMDDRPTRSIQPTAGVTLTPARIPSRTGRDWGAVVEAFLACSESCMVVEATGVKNATSIYASLSPAAKGKPILVTVRNNKCYLVRKGVTK